MRRRHSLLLAGLVLIVVAGGCTTWLGGSDVRSQSPDKSAPETPSTRLVDDLVVPTGMEPVCVEAVGLVTGLHGTGSDPAPSPQRAALLEEMQVRGVENPNRLLASGNVAMVMVRGWLRPGMQEGDRFDVEVRVPGQSETTSLRGGYLLESRLKVMAVMNNQMHPSFALALAKGPVLVDPTADPKKDRVMLCRGRVLGGGVSLKPRPIGLVLLPEHQNVLNSSRVANAINRRFHTFRNGVKSGMAKAKTDEYIELCVHPRYKDNLARYLAVVRALPISETASERAERIESLRGRLLDPATSAQAALQLEALGADGAEPLLAGIQSKDPEVRFYAAESLAYLDRREAAEPLGQIARDQPAFRVFALTALSAMQDFAAYEQLRELLGSTSAETRYGAFRALWTMNNQDALVRGEKLGGQFYYHVLDVPGGPMVHVTRNRLEEVVLFGADQRLQTPLAINAGNEIMITSHGGEEISVSKFTVADGDQKRVVSTRLDDVIRAVAELGGNYPDVVQALQEAKNCGALTSRFEVDALPEAGRTYHRVSPDEQQGELDGEQPPAAAPASPAPELFAKKPDDAGQPLKATDADSETPPTKKGFLPKILGRKNKPSDAE
jgi:flagellar basal body P-ring protein FlgI